MQRLFVCFTLAAIAIPTFPVLVEAQTRTGEDVKDTAMAI